MPKHLIDVNLVKEAAEKSQIAEFIESMPNGYNSFVGDEVYAKWWPATAYRNRTCFYKNARVIVLDDYKCFR